MIRCSPESPDNVPVRVIRCIGDDNYKACDLGPVATGLDRGIRPGGLNGQLSVRLPRVYGNLSCMNSVPSYPEPSLRVLESSK